MALNAARSPAARRDGQHREDREREGDADHVHGGALEVLGVGQGADAAGHEPAGQEVEDLELDGLDGCGGHLRQHQPHELAKGGSPDRGRGRRGMPSRATPTTRVARCSTAPSSAPTAAAPIPSRPWSVTMPTTIPT